MSKITYHPDRGDIVWVNFHPAAGREIDKRRPAVILSPRSYNRKTGLCLAVPTSTDLQNDPFYVPLPEGLLDEPSQVLCDRVRSFDYRERSVAFHGKKVPPDVLNEIIDTVLDLIDPIEKSNGRR